MYTCYIQKLRILASFCSWAGWFEYYLVKNLQRHILAWCGSSKLHVVYSNKRQMSCLMTEPTKWHVRPAKTKISLGIRPVWSESSLSAWRKLGSLAIHWVHSEDADQTGQISRLIRVFAGRTVILLVLSCDGSNDHRALCKSSHWPVS